MARNFLFLDERMKRGERWPLMFWRYGRRIWACRHECSPPLGMIETVKLANAHVHSWVWGHIEPDDVYLPRARLKKI